MPEPLYKRVMLKLGGESLVAEEGDFGLHEDALKNITEEIKAAKERIENTGSETMARVDKYSITSNIYEQIGKMLER